MKKLILALTFCSIILFSEAEKNPTIIFTENKGQVSDQNYKPRPDVLFGGTANDMAFHLRNNGISYQLNRIDKWKEEEGLKTKQKRTVPDQSTLYRLDINWLNCNASAQIKKENALPGYTNYYLEVCPAGVHEVKSYNEITYLNIYNGIDLKWYQKGGNLKYDYLVAAGADYKQIQLEIKGAEKISLNKKGKLIIKTPLGEIIEQEPLVRQDGKILKSKWVIKNSGSTKLTTSVLSFEIENINHEKEFIIDPVVAVRLWGTYYAGAVDDQVTSTTVDISNDVYIAGYTMSGGGTNIATIGSHQSIFGGAGYYDAFLAKFNSNGLRLWSTYYGGISDDLGTTCATDLNGDIFMSGYTQSSSASVIATPSCHQPTYGGGLGWYYDAFLVKFNSNGIRLWGTYYGGDGHEYGSSCVTDQAGNVYLVGNSLASTGTVIATGGSHQPTIGGGWDTFLVKFNTNGVRQWGTYYGGSSDEGSAEVDTDFSNNVFITSTTQSSGTVIATPGSHQATFGGGTVDTYLVKFDAAGVRQWGTYYGGTGDDLTSCCVVDASGNVYISGQTNTSTGTVIATIGCHQPTFGGGLPLTDAFLVKFNPGGIRQWGTYYGGLNNERGYYCTTDATGNVYMTGMTQTSTGTVIATPGSHQSNYGGGTVDAYLVQFNSSGVRQWGTYYGGNGGDNGFCCATDAFGSVYLVGSTTSQNPSTDIATAGSHQTIAGGNIDGFLVKFFNCSSPAPASPTNTTPIVNQSICENYTTTLFATGSGTINWFSSPTSTIVINTGTTFITPTLSTGTYSYYTEAMLCVPSATRTEITVTVNPSPTITVNSGSICIGQSFTLTPGGANTYTFQGGSAIVTPTISTSYSVTGTSAAGCTSTNPAVSNIVVNPLPTITVNSGSICSGQSFTLIPGGANSYTFEGGNSVVSPTSNISFTVAGTSSLGCVSGTTAVANITVKPLPTITVNIGSICSGQFFTITPTGANTYTFQGGNSVVSPTSNASYTVAGTSSLGCVSGTTAVANVTVNPLPVINVSSSNTFICVGETTTLTASGANSYTWNPGGIGTNVIVSPTVTTNYMVTGTDANGCQNTAVFTQSVDLCTGLTQSSSAAADNTKYLIYPNPNNGNFTLEIPESSKIIITDVLGKIIYNEILNDLRSEILLSHSKGVYFVRVINNENLRIIKLIID